MKKIMFAKLLFMCRMNEFHVGIIERRRDRFDLTAEEKIAVFNQIIENITEQNGMIA